MGDWLRDKTISWNSARRRLLQTNAGTFPCETRLQKWGKHPDGICGLCKRSREMVLKLLVGRPARGTTGHLQSSVCRQGTGQSRSVSKEWDFVSKGTEISFGKFVLEHFTLLTLDIQTGPEWSRMRTQLRYGRPQRRTRETKSVERIGQQGQNHL
jgi:hypothetical protein